MQELAGADRVHPADLWPQRLAVARSCRPTRRARRARADDAARGEMEGLALALMRASDPAALLRMSDLCAELGAGAGGRAWPRCGSWPRRSSRPRPRGLLSADVYTKRIASRLLAQLRAAMRGDASVPERLAQDLLFFCVRAAAARPGEQRRAWPRCSRSGPATTAARADYDTPRLGRFDPAVAAAGAQACRRRQGRLVGGGRRRAAPSGAVWPSFALLGDSLQRLFPGGEVLAQRAAGRGRAAPCSEPGSPTPALAMEVATAILYLDAVLEDGELDQPELARARAAPGAAHPATSREGAEPQPLEPWMEELYRRISDRQTMGSVVQELRASLSEVEKQIDQYFRDPAQRELLIPVPAQLSSMRGVLSVLGMDQASQAVLHMRDDVDALAQTEVDPKRAVQTGTFDRLADNLGALSFLIDMLSVQPQLAKIAVPLRPRDRHAERRDGAERAPVHVCRVRCDGARVGADHAGAAGGGARAAAGRARQRAGRRRRDARDLPRGGARGHRRSPRRRWPGWRRRATTWPS